MHTFILATRSVLVTEASSIGGDFMTVSAYLRAAPSAMMRFGLVGEPQDARRIFTALHEFEIGSCEQRGSSFRDWSQNRFGCILSSHGVDPQWLRSTPRKLGVTLARR